MTLHIAYTSDYKPYFHLCCSLSTTIFCEYKKVFHHSLNFTEHWLMPIWPTTNILVQLKYLLSFLSREEEGTHSPGRHALLKKDDKAMSSSSAAVLEDSLHITLLLLVRTSLSKCCANENKYNCLYTSIHKIN
jgi:hypothetical protein